MGTVTPPMGTVTPTGTLTPHGDAEPPPTRMLTPHGCHSSGWRAGLPRTVPPSFTVKTACPRVGGTLGTHSILFGDVF